MKIHERHNWLLEYASRLASTGCRLPVPILDIIASLGIEIKCEVVSSEKGAAGSLAFIEERPIITIFRVDESRALTSREFFTIAHELGHYLLIKHDDVSVRGNRDYYYVENLCNNFAGRLLVPEFILDGFSPCGAKYAHNYLMATVAKTSVSPEVAARRLVERYDNVSFFLAAKGRNKAGSSVWKLSWGVGGSAALKFQRNLHLLPDLDISIYLDHIKNMSGLVNASRDHPLRENLYIYSKARGSGILVAIYTAR